MNMDQDSKIIELESELIALRLDYIKACKQRDYFDSQYTRCINLNLSQMRYVMDIESKLGIPHKVWNYEEIKAV